MQRGEAAARSRAAVPRLLQVDGLLEHGQRVLVDVLVPVVLVDLQGAAPAARAARGRPARCRPAARSPRARLRGADQLDQLVAHPLGRHDRDAVGHLPVIAATHRRGRPRSRAAPRTGPPAASAAGRRRTSPRVGPACAARRRPRSPSPPCGSTNVIVRQRHRHRVDGEVAAHQVVLEACRRRSPRACASRGRRPRRGRS